MNPEVEQKSFLQKYKFTLISLFIIILAAIPLLLLSNSAKKPAMVEKMTPTASPSPTAEPVTAQNVDPTLTQTDKNMQTTLNQMDTDLQSVSKIDTSQDSTTGL